MDPAQMARNAAALSEGTEIVLTWSTDGRLVHRQIMKIKDFDADRYAVSEEEGVAQVPLTEVSNVLILDLQRTAPLPGQDQRQQPRAEGAAAVAVVDGAPANTEVLLPFPTSGTEDFLRIIEGLWPTTEDGARPRLPFSAAQFIISHATAEAKAVRAVQGVGDGRQVPVPVPVTVNATAAPPPGEWAKVANGGLKLHKHVPIGMRCCSVGHLLLNDAMTDTRTYKELTDTVKRYEAEHQKYVDSNSLRHRPGLKPGTQRAAARVVKMLRDSFHNELKAAYDRHGNGELDGGLDETGEIDPTSKFGIDDLSADEWTTLYEMAAAYMGALLDMITKPGLNGPVVVATEIADQLDTGLVKIQHVFTTHLAKNPYAQAAPPAPARAAQPKAPSATPARQGSRAKSQRFPTYGGGAPREQSFNGGAGNGTHRQDSGALLSAPSPAPIKPSEPRSNFGTTTGRL